MAKNRVQKTKNTDQAPNSVRSGSLARTALVLSGLALCASLIIPWSGVLGKTATLPVGNGTSELSAAFLEASQAVVAIEAQRPEGIEHGAGTIFTSDGEVLTSYHVIEAAMQNKLPIHVLLSDGRYVTAEVTLYDKGSDVAVLTLNRAEYQGSLPVASIDNIPEVRIGDHIATVGNPLGTGSTHGFGWVAGLNFPLHRKGIDTYGEHVEGDWYVTSHQVDMNSTKGNSGGPVFTTDGKFFGIVIAGRIANGMPEGFTYIVPAEIIRDNIAQLRKDGKITRPFLGISAKRGTYTADGNTHIGVTVTKVLEDSPSGRAGLMADDVIIGINGKRVPSMNHYIAYIHDLPSTRPAEFEVIRDGKPVMLTLNVSQEK